MMPDLYFIVHIYEYIEAYEILATARFETLFRREYLLNYLQSRFVFRFLSVGNHINTNFEMQTKKPHYIINGCDGSTSTTTTNTNHKE